MRQIGTTSTPVPAHVLCLIAEMQRSGVSLRYIAQYLTDSGIPTATGMEKWSPASVRSVALSRRGVAAREGRLVPLSPLAEIERPDAPLSTAIRERRVSLRLTTRRVGALAGVSATTVERAERCAERVDSQSMAAVLVAVGFSLSGVAELIRDDERRLAVLRAMFTLGMSEEELLHG